VFPAFPRDLIAQLWGDVDVNLNLNLEEMRMWTPVRRAKNPQPAGALKLYCYLLSLALRCLRSAGNLIVWQLIKKKAS